MSYKYFQSSKKKRASDCSVRCIMAAEGLDWKTAFGKKRRLSVSEFAKRHKKGTFILSLTGHVVCVKNGHWYDTWDCGDYKVFKYWEKV